MNKPSTLYHISSKLSKDETVLKPHRNFIQSEEEEGMYVFASSGLDYISAFRNDYSQFQGGTTLQDGTRIFLIVTKDIERLRKEMIENPSNIYVVSSESFSQTYLKDGTPTEEWISKDDVPILKRDGTVEYEDILKNVQIFFLQQENFTRKQYDEMINWIHINYGSNAKKAIRDLVKSGKIVYENKTQGINSKWLEEKDLDER